MCANLIDTSRIGLEIGGQANAFSQASFHCSDLLLQNPHRDPYFYFSPSYYQTLHPARYAPSAELAPFKYNTDAAQYKGAWFDYLEWHHYKRW
jgi:hypothetical protein